MKQCDCFPLKKPEGTDQYSVEHFNENMDVLDQIIKTIRNNIAELYDDTATYKVGDLCIQDCALYRCTTEITTAEAFDSTKWTLTDVVSEVSQKQDVLSLGDLKPGDNIDSWKDTYIASVKSSIKPIGTLPSFSALGFDFNEFVLIHIKEEYSYIQVAFGEKVGEVAYRKAIGNASDSFREWEDWRLINEPMITSHTLSNGDCGLPAGLTAEFVKTGKVVDVYIKGTTTDELSTNGQSAILVDFTQSSDSVVTNMKPLKTTLEYCILNGTYYGQLACTSNALKLSYTRKFTDPTTQISIPANTPIYIHTTYITE